MSRFWDEHRLQAYEGVSVPGFPNLFNVFGPWQDSCRLANSYYFDKNGDVPLRPATTVEAYWRSRRFPLDDYRFTA